jgi:hypothetical protein
MIEKWCAWYNSVHRQVALEHVIRSNICSKSVRFPLDAAADYFETVATNLPPHSSVLKARHQGCGWQLDLGFYRKHPVDVTGKETGCTTGKARIRRWREYYLEDL